MLYLRLKSDFLPDMDEGGFVIDYLGPPGTSLAETDRTLLELEKVLRATPEVQRIVLIDAPSVLGWDIRRAIDAEYGLGVLERALQHAIDAGRLMPTSASAVAHVLAGALDEAAMVVARAEDPTGARQEMGQTIRRLLEGLRGPQA